MDSKSEENLSEVDGGCFGKTQKITFPRTSTEKNIEHYIPSDLRTTDPGDLVNKNRITNYNNNNEENDIYYKMNNKDRGYALIFNHQYYNSRLQLSERQGTNKDRDELEKTLYELGFLVEKYQDLRYEDIIDHVSRVAARNHSKKDCVLVAILTHGDPNKVYAYDQIYNPELLWKKFRPIENKTLEGKPILFFINACQGQKYDDGVLIDYELIDTDEKKYSEKDTNLCVSGTQHSNFQIPNQKDLLVVYSTAPGYYSWRNTSDGSWFIQELCTQLNEYKYKEHLLTILTYVSQRVAIDYESNTKDVIDDRKKQIPCIFSQLTKLLKFVEPDDENKKCCVV